MSLGTFLANPLGSITSGFLGEADSGSIWNNNADRYRIPSATESANEFSGTGLDPNGLVAGLWNDITGQTSQSREFAQQEYLQDKMNAYNHPVEQMNRAMEAGINPNLAAQGIAQAGSQSAQAPSVASNAGGVANGIGQAAGAVASLGSGAVGFAGASLARKQAEEVATLLPIKASALTNESLLTLENIGLSRANAQAISIMNYYRPEQLQLDIARARLTLPYMMSQMKLFEGQYQSAVADAKLDMQKIEESKANISLMEYQKGLVAAQTALANASAKRTNQIYEMVNAMGFDPYAGSAFIQLMRSDLSDEDFNAVYDNLMEYTFESARQNFLGSNNLPHDSFETPKTLEEGLIKAREDAEKRINKENRKGEFLNKTADKWIRVPSSAGVGPFSMSTQ